MTTEDRSLIKKFHKSGLLFLGALLVITLILTGVCMYMDLNPEYKQSFYRRVKSWEFLKDFVPYLKVLRNQIHNHIESYSEMIITYNTILTAVIIFFYSVMDNRRGGISYRTLISYTLGSWTLPGLFVITLLLMPFIYHFQEICRWTVIFFIFYIFLVQIFIIIMILVSTSYFFAIKVITRVEIKQFAILKSDNVKREYVWQYLLRHMIEVFKSEELLCDKVRMIRSILWVPFYQRSILHEKLCGEKLYQNNMQAVYQFYFENLRFVFLYCCDTDKKDERDELFNMLYEFLERFEKWYIENTNNTKEKNREELNSVNIFHMVYCGVLNAVMLSGIEEKEKFCNYVFDHYIKDKKLRDTQIDLYILFHEMLFITQKKTSYDISNSEEIKWLYEWKIIPIEKMKEYGKFWKIWFDCYSTNRKKKIEHFIRASHTMCGSSSESEAISDIIQFIEKKRRESL